jgi:CheY-like chemotaxis protein
VRFSIDPSVLIVDDEPNIRLILREHVLQFGCQAIEADGPTAAIAVLERVRAISLVLSDVRMPTARAGLAFMRAVRQRWPEIPLAAVTGDPGDLDELLGYPESPVLILRKPFWARQVEEVLRLAIRMPAIVEQDARQQGPDGRQQPAVLVADEDAAFRARVKAVAGAVGYEVEEAATGSEARAAFERKRFAHAFLDLAIPNGRGQLASVIDRTNPTTMLISTASRSGMRPTGGPITVLPKTSDDDAIVAALAFQRVEVTN